MGTFFHMFILCMDLLIRKVNGDNEKEGLNIGINGEHIEKLCGSADHIVFIILPNFGLS